MRVDDGAQSNRRRRLDPGQRVQSCRHADDAARESPIASVHPAIVLVGGSGPTDRDETVVGIPIFAQLAKSLADGGFIVLRYDKRGIGQSGGRTETATLTDYADDVMAAVKWLSQRKDVDERKIVVVGHSEGGAVALIAAAREKKIDGVVTIAAPGSKGADLVLAAAAHALDLTEALGRRQAGQDRPAEENPGGRRQRKRLGGRSGRGRKQADTPWFRSLLTYDPSEVVSRR